MSISRFSFILITVCLSWVILKTLQDFLIPLVFSVAIWLFIRKLRNIILKLFRNKLPFWLGTTLASLVILFVIYLFIQMLTSQVSAFIEPDNLAEYEKQMRNIGDKIVNMIGSNTLATIQDNLSNLSFAGAASNFLGVLTNLMGNSFLVLLYLLFLIMEEHLFKPKLNAIYKNPESRKSIFETISKITHSVEGYITLKTIVSVITGVASYIALWALGIDFPLFWALLIFILNYIPTIGSLIATIFPALMGLIEFQEISMFFYVLAVIGSIQLIVGNIIEPRIMGNSLNISPLVVIVSLTLWGTIWGVVGMILSVPIMVVLIIIFSKIPATKSLAIMLSSNGNV